MQRACCFNENVRRFIRPHRQVRIPDEFYRIARVQARFGIFRQARELPDKNKKFYSVIPGFERVFRDFAIEAALDSGVDRTHANSSTFLVLSA